ncbi:hypothetical protein EES45_30635 [Streptomyces sp. ADI97-07]|uniref:hypothetical protein n=1 Tax=Streptomyces sp. ADI97-07 TaxID=1522762 RepID=UPI000F552491|nr:hypothetical protein [Streptomyces sp. ADI97-07]RPK73308.1 hypothetical protein EES45_30635 [Streptomyces sp. ADI97-07]
MTTAHHLRLIDGMRARAFPPERTSSVSGVSGPGYHTAFLHTEDLRDDRDGAGCRDGADRGDEAEHVGHRAQRLAECDALLALLTLRWGEPQAISLWSAQERMSAGEVMPEPWAEVVASCEDVRMWRTEGRWVVLTLHVEEEGPGCEMSVLVTVVDPP